MRFKKKKRSFRGRSRRNGRKSTMRRVFKASAARGGIRK